MLTINAGAVLNVEVNKVDVYEIPPLQRCSTINDIQIESKKEKTEHSNEVSVVQNTVMNEVKNDQKVFSIKRSE